jgi:hypothetical protein
MHQDALKCLIQSHQMAKQDQSDQSDSLRFKVQEMHMLNNFYQDFNSIEYNEKVKLNVPKTLIHENLM